MLYEKRKKNGIRPISIYCPIDIVIFKTYLWTGKVARGPNGDQHFSGWTLKPASLLPVNWRGRSSIRRRHSSKLNRRSDGAPGKHKGTETRFVILRTMVRGRRTAIDTSRPPLTVLSTALASIWHAWPICKIHKIDNIIYMNHVFKNKNLFKITMV